MSKRSLPNNYNSLTENISINPSAKKVKYLGNVPGIPTLTDNYFDQGAVTNLENEGNEGTSINITVRNEDQEYVNQHQYVWLVNTEETRQKLMSLAQVNEFLARVQTDTSCKPYYEEFHNPAISQKAWIVDKLIPFGCLSVQNAKKARYFTNAPKSVHNVEYHGRSFVFDYWSYGKNRIASYANLYFVLRKVHIKNNHSFVTKISPGLFEDGSSVAKNETVWQVVPFFKNNGDITFDDYVTNDEFGQPEVGYYWYIGRVHEYQAITSPGAITLRNELTTSRSTYSLYNVDDNTPIHVYLLRDNKCPLLIL